MSEPTMKSRWTLEAEIRDLVEEFGDRPNGIVPVGIERLRRWQVLASNGGMTREQEERAAERVRELLSDRDTKIEGLEIRNNELREEVSTLKEEAKQLRLELGRFLDQVDADGDGTVVESPG